MPTQTQKMPTVSPVTLDTARAAVQSGFDVLQQWNDAVYAPMMQNAAQMWTDALKSMTQTSAKSGDCNTCASDDCHCQCCISDADLVVYARLGETRVVPLTLENNRRRERPIRLDLSNWTTLSGKAVPVQTVSLTPTEFTLAACEEREALLTIKIGIPNADGNIADGESNTVIVGEGRRFTDLDECLVAYADLRVEGCENRPVRIAIAVLPRDCATYKIDCRCGCC